MKTRILLPVLRARSLATLTAVAIAALLSSCAYLNQSDPESKPEPPVAEKKPPPEPIKPPPPSKLYEWYGSDEYVSRIEIDIDAQKALFYSGDKKVGWTTVASGIFNYPTPTGTFAVLEKVQDKKSNLYGKIYNNSGKLVKRNAKLGVHPIPAGGSFKGAPMPYFLRLTNDGIGLHAGPIPRPGNRASHGCIRMPKKFAPILYRYVDIGTPVTITGNGPTYASYVAKQRRSTPKPVPVAVAEADPPVAPATESTSPDGPATGAPAVASDGTAAAAPPTEAPAPSPATGPPADAPGLSTAAVPADSPAASVPAAATAYAPAATASAEPSAPAPAPAPTPGITGMPSPSPGGPVAPGLTPTSAGTPAALPTAPGEGMAAAPAPSPGDTARAPVPEATSPPVPEASQAPIPESAAETTDSPVSPTPPAVQRAVPVEATPPRTAAEASAQNEG